jgi:CRP-like cAMP-binding protein
MLQSTVLATPSQPDLRQLLEELYRGRSLHPFCSGQEIEMLPHQIWVICRGVVQLGTLYDSGDEALLGLAGPSMPFGLPLTLIRPYQAIALTDVDLMCLTEAEVYQLPILAQGIFRQLTRRLRQTEGLLAMIGHRRIEDRLRHFLLLLQQEIGSPEGSGTRLTLRLTHQQLANAIGTTRVTVTRLLSQLREEGWLTIDKQRHIVISNNVITSDSFG